MNTTELRERILRKVNKMNDEEALNTIDKVIDTFNDVDEVYTLTKEQEDVIKKSDEQDEKGDTITNEEAYKKIKDLLK